VAGPRIGWLDLGLLHAAAIWGSTFFVVKAALADIHPFTKEGMALGSLLVVLYVSQTAGLQFTTASNSARGTS
jgi:hypothetical protein